MPLLNSASNTSENQRAAVWYPGPSPDLRVETVPMPKIEHPDDAIIRITLGGLCGSDLHVYRGHGEFTDPIVMGHEFIGIVIALGSSFTHSDQAHTTTNKGDRPELYTSLKIGDKVVSPFTISCGECHYCRLGFTCRCPSGQLIGTPTLPGGQAQYIRIPLAGGTLYNVSSPSFYSSLGLKEVHVDDSSLLLMADILPTGVFAATQALAHGKIRPMLKGAVYPALENTGANGLTLTAEDRKLTIAVIGLGPVGICACVSLLEMLEDARKQGGPSYKIVAIDLTETRRKKMQAIHHTMSLRSEAVSSSEFVVSDIDSAKSLLSNSCEAVLEVVGHSSALSLAYTLVRPFGLITSIGVHSVAPLPFTGRDLYAKNVSLDFGRCPVRAMFDHAFRILIKRQDVFSGPDGLVEKVTSLENATELYKEFEAGKIGKVLFDPWS